MPKASKPKCKSRQKKNLKYESSDSENSYTDGDFSDSPRSMRSKLVNGVNAAKPVSKAVDPNEISRWLDIMNNSENINVAFLQILKEIEENIIERIDIFQKDIASKIETKSGAAVQKPLKVFKNANLKELENELGVTFPLQDIESFESFDDDLEKDPEKMDALREMLLHQIDGLSSPTKDVYKLVRFITVESVIAHYTMCGKNYRGLRKKNFNTTNVYLCMEDVLSHKHMKTPSDLKLTFIMGSYFSRINFKQKNLAQPDNHLEG